MNEVINSIRDLLKAQFGSTYKKYYNAEIRVPNLAEMPFIEVIKDNTLITNRWTGWMHSDEFNIIITVKSSLKKYLKQNTNIEILDYSSDLAEKVEGRDSNMDIKDNTIIWVILNNLKLSNKVNIVWDFNILYDEMDLWDSYLVYAKINLKAKLIAY